MNEWGRDSGAKLRVYMPLLYTNMSFENLHDNASDHITDTEEIQANSIHGVWEQAGHH